MTRALLALGSALLAVRLLACSDEPTQDAGPDEGGGSGIGGAGGPTSSGGSGQDGKGSGAGLGGGAGAKGGAAGSGAAGGEQGGGEQGGGEQGGGEPGGGESGGSGQAGEGGVGGQGGGAGAGQGGQAGATTKPEPPFDWVGVIGTGQSLSVGSQGVPVVSKKQPYGNLRLLDEGPAPKFPADGGGTYKAAPLIEPIRGTIAGYPNTDYPDNINGETPHAGMANQITALFQARGGDDYITAHTAVGWGGKPLVCLDKEPSSNSACVVEGQTVKTRGYTGALNEAKAFLKLAKAKGKTFGYGAVILTHGEADATNPDYKDGLVKLQADYQKDLQAITGQTSGIPLLISQTSAREAGNNSSSVQVWRAGVENPGKIICVGPKYAYQYAGDHLHFPAASYVRLGEKYGEVFDLVVNQGMAWQPLQPDPKQPPSVKGSVITVPFHVPNPPLAWDSSQPLNHQSTNKEWAKGRGFEVTSKAGTRLVIQSVAIEGSAVKITLAKAPVAQDGLFVGYALNADATGAQGGLVGGLRGDLRDSDDLVGYDAEVIAVKVTKGSKTVKPVAGGTFLARAGRDVVTGAGGSLPADAIVATVVSADELTLSDAWTGASGTVMLGFHHDLRNYAVQFRSAVKF